MLESLAQEKLGGMAKAALRSRSERLALAPLLGNLLTAMIAEARGEDASSRRAAPRTSARTLRAC